MIQLGVLVALTHTSLVWANQESRLDHFISLSLEDLVSLETTIATASKQTVSKAPAVVTLITADDIKAIGATNLVEVLEGVPGIHIRVSQFGNRPLVQFRGAKGTQTLLMINGNSMTDLAWNFGIFWKGLPASVIERVEIIRGPGSALFGADASAGVVNVITKTAGKIEHSEVGVRSGSFNSKSAWLQHGASWNGYEIGVTANVSDTDGYNPLIISDGQTARDQTFGTNVSLAPGKAQYGYRNEDLRFSVAKGYWRLLSGYTSSSDLEIGLTGFGVLDPVTKASDSRYNIDLFYNNEAFSKNWELDVELRYQNLDYSSGSGFQERPLGYTDGTGVYTNGQINQYRSSERRMVFESSTLYSGIADHLIRMGGGYSQQEIYMVDHMVNFGTGPDGNQLPAGGPIVDVSGTPYAFAPQDSREITYAYLQDIWTISNAWELTVGARYDYYSDFGSALNPRLALVWQTTEKLITKLLYGQAFRPPSYQELFDETSFSIPNPNLKPENSETLDLVFSYAASKVLQLDMNIFYFQQTDIIRLDRSSGQYQNTGDHIIRGIELEARWQASKDISVSGNYTIREQSDSDLSAIQEPVQDAYLRADWGFKSKWNWNMQTSWTGERKRRATDSRPALDGDLITDTTLRYAASNSWELAASIRNLFDVDAREWTSASINNDLPLPERNAYAEVRYKF